MTLDNEGGQAWTAGKEGSQGVIAGSRLVMVPVDGQNFGFVVAGLEVGTEGHLHVRRQGRGEETNAGGRR